MDVTKEFEKLSLKAVDKADHQKCLEQIHTLQERHREYKKKTLAKLQEHEQRFSICKRVCDELRHQNHNYKVQIDNANSDNTHLLEMSLVSTNLVKNKEAHIDLITNQKDEEIEKINAELGKSLRQLSENRNAMARLNREVDKLKIEHKNWKSKSETLSRTVENLKSEVKKLKEQNKNLKDNLSVIKGE